MKYGFHILLVAIGMTAITSCKKGKDVTPTPDPDPNPTPSWDTTLKAVASFPIGIAIEYDLFKNNASYKNVVVRETDQVTFGYSMKHGAIVKNDGSFDYSKADELVTWPLQQACKCTVIHWCGMQIKTAII